MTEKWGKPETSSSVTTERKWDVTTTTCPLCRGYNVERRWCDHCNRTGYVPAPRTRTEGARE